MEAALAFRNLGNTTKPSINQFFYQGKKKSYVQDGDLVYSCKKLVAVSNRGESTWSRSWLRAWYRSTLQLTTSWYMQAENYHYDINLSMSGILEANSDTHKENVWRSSANHIYSAWMQLSRSYLKLSNYELVIQICIIHRLLLYVLYMCVRLTMNQNKLGWT